MWKKCPFLILSYIFAFPEGLGKSKKTLSQDKRTAAKI
jgi:hypothetical protein